MRTSPLLADFIHARGCKPICAKLLTLPIVEINKCIYKGNYKGINKSSLHKFKYKYRLISVAPQHYKMPQKSGVVKSQLCCVQ